ncbi:MAG: PAS domain S-box protein [Parvibaculaceae bacterium]
MKTGVVDSDIIERTRLTRGLLEQRAFYRLTDRLYRSRALAEAYEAALDAIVELLGCEKASILRFDPAGVMRFVASRGLSDAYRAAVEGHSPWRKGDVDPDSIYVADIEKAKEPESLKATIRVEGIRALGFIPLTVNQAVVGKFMLYHTAPHEFDERERQIALIIARQLGFSIERQAADVAAGRLVALVESSDDAIVAKTLDGVIQNWNRGAESLFGYTAEEVIGKSITILIPPDRLTEEETILSRIRKGERMSHYATIRRRKDGSLIHVSLTISPIIDASGQIIGASKIARNFTDQHLAQERQQLLLREMNHRVKNLFAVTSSILSLTARQAESPSALASSVISRLDALARAHGLTMAGLDAQDLMRDRGTTMHALARSILSPHGEADERFTLRGEDIQVSAKAVTPVALLLHEFATNAAKYGSLSVPGGRVGIDTKLDDGVIELAWRETGGPAVESTQEQGFGSRLVEATARQLEGDITRDWGRDGLLITLRLAATSVMPAP